MTLHYETLSPAMHEVLKKLMQIPELASFRLVGGTSLSLNNETFEIAVERIRTAIKNYEEERRQKARTEMLTETRVSQS